MTFEHRLDEALGIEQDANDTLFELNLGRAIGAAGLGLAALAGAGEAGAAPAPQVAQAQELTPPAKPKTADEKAEELVKPLREAYDKEVKVAQDKYNKILTVELEKATKAGSLDDVKAIRKEMEEPEGDESKWKSPAHKAAAKQFVAAKEVAKKKWDVGIAGLVKMLVQKKELDVAEKVKGKELNIRKPIINGIWIWDNGIGRTPKTVAFRDDGTVEILKNDPLVGLQGEWHEQNGKIEVVWSNGSVDVITLIDANSATGRNKNGKTYKLERDQK